MEISENPNGNLRNGNLRKSKWKPNGWGRWREVECIGNLRIMNEEGEVECLGVRV